MIDHSLHLHASKNRARALLAERGPCPHLNTIEAKWRLALENAQILHQ